MNINRQLERIGDIAVNIAERVDPLLAHMGFVKRTKLAEMAEIARIMVRDSLAAFITNDAALAGMVLVSDGVVDSLSRSVLSHLVSETHAREELVKPGPQLLILSRHLERVADHATNIAEGVIFVVEAKLVKHHGQG